MAELKEYKVVIAGIPHTMLLSKEDARKRGLIKPASKSEAVDVEAEVAEQVKERVSVLEAEFEGRVEAEVARRVDEANAAAEAEKAKQEAEAKAVADKTAAAKNK